MSSREKAQILSITLPPMVVRFIDNKITKLDWRISNRSEAIRAMVIKHLDTYFDGWDESDDAQ